MVVAGTKTDYEISCDFASQHEPFPTILENVHSPWGACLRGTRNKRRDKYFSRNETIDKQHLIEHFHVTNTNLLTVSIPVCRRTERARGNRKPGTGAVPRGRRWILMDLRNDATRHFPSRAKYGYLLPTRMACTKDTGTL